jgi:hypothetical protein
MVDESEGRGSLASGEIGMKFSIIHPTARVTPGFEHPWNLAFASAYACCDRPEDVEYILVVHKSRIKAFWHIFPKLAPNWNLDRHGWGRFQVITNSQRDCLVDQCNAGMLAAQQGEIWIGNQDDMRYPEHWDTEILKLIPDTSKLICLQPGNDGRRPDLLALPTIITKALADEVGPVSPEYESMQSDVEASIKFRQLGLVIPAPHIYFQHFHPSARSSEKSKMDAIYELENSDEAYRIGTETFFRRQAQGFPYVNLPGFRRPASVAPAVPTRAISICIPGEQHRMEWEVPFWEVLDGLANDHWDLRIHPEYSTYVHHARMMIATKVILCAQHREPDYVVWIDDDNTPSIGTLRRLIAILDSHPEIDGAVGWYYFMSKGVADADVKEQLMICAGDFCADSLNLIPITPQKLFADGRSLKPIDWAGFGCVVMRYNVQKTLGPRAWKPIDSDANEFGATGDDSSFFARAKDAGFKFVVDPNAFVDHWKTRPIRPDFEVHAGASDQAKAIIEQDREKRNGPRLQMTKDAYESMEAAKM